MYGVSQALYQLTCNVLLHRLVQSEAAEMPQQAGMEALERAEILETGENLSCNTINELQERTIHYSICTGTGTVLCMHMINSKCVDHL